jgi:hypothetical protein
VTVADATGSLEPSSVTRPVIRRVCAHALVANTASNMNDMTNERVVLTRLSMVGWRWKRLPSGLSCGCENPVGLTESDFGQSEVVP